MTTIRKKIALNPQRKPHKGRVSEQLLEAYDCLTAEAWLKQMVDNIRGGNEALKSELPFRAAHYYRFKQGHRTQKEADPEAFLFQTTVDVDDRDLVERAIQQATADEAYKKGVEMIMNSMKEMLDKCGVTVFGARGESFDPKLHNAVMHGEDESLGENQIAEVFQKGFRIGEKVVRFAMVRVAN